MCIRDRARVAMAWTNAKQVQQFAHFLQAFQALGVPTMCFVGPVWRYRAGSAACAEGIKEVVGANTHRLQVFQCWGSQETPPLPAHQTFGTVGAPCGLSKETDPEIGAHVKKVCEKKRAKRRKVSANFRCSRPNGQSWWLRPKILLPQWTNN
eukprot:116951-Amphidinium_carterae.1